MLHILLPTFNRASLLRETLSSLRAQDADPSSWHLTVVDNASTDETRKLLEETIATWSNFDYQVNDRNIGLFGNLNRCMDLARSRKYMILHSDDIVSPQLVSSVQTFLSRNPQVDMSFGSCKAMIEETGEILDFWYKSRLISGEERVLQQGSLATALICSGTNFIFAPTVVYDREFFDPSMRYSTELEYAADLDLWFRAAMRAPLVGYIPGPLITCRIHADRLSSRYSDTMRREVIGVVRKHLRNMRAFPELHSVNNRTISVVEAKLRLFELAIRMKLVPGFKMRRGIATLFERAAQISMRKY